jgi:PAS domain S-box-containing protein
MEMGNAIGIEGEDRGSPDGAWSSERTLAMLDAVREGIKIIAFDWRYVYVNDAVCRRRGQARESLLGRAMQECHPGIEGTEIYRAMERGMCQRQSVEVVSEFVHGDGAKTWIELRIEPCPEGIFVLSVDLGPRKDLEAHGGQAEKGAAIGELAGSIAHDFNNLLTAIKGFTDCALAAAGPDSPAADDLREVLDAANRARALAGRLLALARNRPESPTQRLGWSPRRG